MADAVAPRRTNWFRWLPAAYLVLSLAWIFGSDRLLDQWFADDPGLLLTVGTIKGVLFVTASAALLYVLVSTRPIAAGMAVDGERPAHLWRPLIAFVIFGAPVALAGYLVYAATYRSYLHDTSAALSTGARVSAQAAYLWLDGRSRAVRQFVGSSSVVLAARDRIRESSPDTEAALTQRLEALRVNQGFAGVQFYSDQGDPVAEVGSGIAMTPVLRSSIRDALLHGSPQVVSLRRTSDPAGKPFYVDFVARIGGRSTVRVPQVGVVVARAAAAELLELLAAPTLVGVRTGASALVARDGDSVRYIAQAGGLPSPVGAPMLQRMEPGLASTRVIHGDQGPFEAADATGERVLAAGHAVPGTDWYVVTQVSLSEIAYAQRRAFALAWGLGAAGLALVAALVLLWWRNEQARFALRLRHEQARADAAAQRFAMISRHAGDAMLLVEQDGRIVDANERVAEIYGYSATEIVGKTIFELQAEEVRELELVHAGPEPGPRQRALRIESRHRRRDGSTFPVEVTATRVEFQGRPYVLCIVRDISQRKAQDDEIARLAGEHDRLLHRLRLQFDEMPIGCILVDMSGAVVDVNPKFERLFGYRLADLAVSNLYQLVFPPKVLDAYRRVLSALPSADGPITEVFENLTRDGRCITCRWTAAALREADGTQVGVLAMCQDVSAKVAAEQALRASAEQLQAAQRLASVGSWEVDLATRRAKHSDETFRICGVRRGELPNTIDGGFALVHPDDQEALRARFAALIDGGGALEEERFRVVRPDGTVVYVSARGRLERGTDGRPLRLLGSIHDITAIVLAQKQVERQRDLYDLLAQSNQLIARSEDELTLYRGLAELVVARGGFAFAWVGAPGPGGELRRLAASGDDEGFIDALLAADSAGRLAPDYPSIGAMHGRRTSLASQMPSDPRVGAATAILAAKGVRSVAAFPIGPLDAPGPALTVYGKEPDTFDARTVATLEDMADDITFGLAAMATRKALDERTRLLQTTIDGSDSPIHATDSAGRILLANEAWRRVNQCTEDTLTGRPVVEILRPDAAASQRLIDAMVLESGRPRIFEERGELDGQEMLWLVTRFPLRNASGSIYGVGGIATDVTGLRRMEDELVEANRGLEARIAARTGELESAKERAERADRTKSAFLSTMSHELRTPLNSILGFTDILIDGLSGPINDEQRRQLGIVKGASLHLLELINDVLDISRVEAGELRLEIEDVDVTEVMRQRVQELSPLATRKGIELDCAFLDSVAPIRSDRRRVSQIIGNLLSNAVKFTDHGGVSASIRRRDESLEIVVRDTGCGILPEDLGKLFVPFAQMKRTQAAATEGTGLGLAISRHFARALGGDISVTSEPGVGSSFALVLPLRTEASVDLAGTGVFRRIAPPPA